MEIYLIYLAVVFSLPIILEKYNTNSTQRILLVLSSAMALFLIAAFRSETVGKDVWGYLDFFRKCINLEWAELLDFRFEKGFIVLCKIISLFTEDTQFFIAIVSFLIISGPTYIIYKYSKNPAISFVLYVGMTFFAFSMSGLRQALATSILLFGYNFIIQRKPIKFIFLVLFASLFHSSVVVFLIAYPLAKIKISFKKIIVYLILFFFLYLTKNYLINFMVMTLFSQYSEMLVESDSYNYMLSMLLVWIFGLIYYKQVIKRNENAIVLFNMILIAVFVQMFGSESSNITRISELFYIYVILLIPEVLSVVNDRVLKITGYILILLAVIFQFVVLFPGGGYGAVPYMFFWEI